MEQNGRLTSVHGGSIAKSGMEPFKEFEERNKEFGKQKYELSLKTTEFISKGDIIGIDSGSTAISFAEVLIVCIFKKHLYFRRQSRLNAQ